MRSPRRLWGASFPLQRTRSATTGRPTLAVTHVEPRTDSAPRALDAASLPEQERGHPWRVAACVASTRSRSRALRTPRKRKTARCNATRPTMAAHVARSAPDPGSGAERTCRRRARASAAPPVLQPHTTGRPTVPQRRSRTSPHSRAFSPPPDVRPASVVRLILDRTQLCQRVRRGRRSDHPDPATAKRRRRQRSQRLRRAPRPRGSRRAQT
jgi:hypothetical protein